jgi:UDP-GlcNAc:undecaprenyl-phosphate GlcNAc-1-phosphate transferase
MTPSLLAFAASLSAALALTPLARRIALVLGIVDLPGSARKVHTAAIPRLGGAAVCGAFLVGLGLVALHPDGRTVLFQQPMATGGFLLGAIGITLVGIWDDARGLRYDQKFAAEFVIAVLLYAFGYRIQVLSLPWVADFHLGILSFPVTLLWLVGITNAVNLIDGLDGLAAGVSLFALATVFINASLDGNLVVLPLVAALFGATLGFFPYNRHPARIFLGDGGALLLGSALGALSMRAYSKAPATMALVAPVIMLGLPITDTVVSMLRRYLRGRSPFEADREHLHHRMLALGLSQRGSVLALYSIAAAFSALTLALRGHSPARSALGLALGIGLVLVLLRALNYKEVLHLFEGLRAVRAARARARERLLWLKEQRRGWRGVRTHDELWVLLAETPGRLGLSTLELHLPRARSFRVGSLLRARSGAQARFLLERAGGPLGELVVAVAGHRQVLLDDERLVYEYLADFVADALEEMTRRAAGLATAPTLPGVGVVPEAVPTLAVAGAAAVAPDGAEPLEERRTPARGQTLLGIDGPTPHAA